MSNRPFVPPYPAGVIQSLEARGHSVTVRQDRNGSNRYSIDGRRELTAAQMSNYFERLYGPGKDRPATGSDSLLTMQLLTVF